MIVKLNQLLSDENFLMNLFSYLCNAFCLRFICTAKNLRIDR
jgi:hypothetical protein